MVSIQQLFTRIPLGSVVRLKAWIKNKRESKKYLFLSLCDGSTLTPIQGVIGMDQVAEGIVGLLTVGSSIEVEGKLVASPGREQCREISMVGVSIVGRCPSDYPIQPKPHTLAFLRSLPHLRFRTKTFQAVFRIRHRLAYAIHTFFHERGFYWLHTPIITSIDTEGAGETFSVVAPYEHEDKPFFGDSVALTVSGQLAAESGALGLGKVYTFGPTFRAENSNTTRHLSEFWMVEPEVAFYDLNDIIALAEVFLRTLITTILEEEEEGLAFLGRRAHRYDQGGGLQEQLQRWVNKPFIRISYGEAIQQLEEVQRGRSDGFLYPVSWGCDLQTEHERYLTGYYQGIVCVTDYPKEVKAFYMRQNKDRETVAAMDILLPGIGEVIGGVATRGTTFLFRKCHRSFFSLS